MATTGGSDTVSNKQLYDALTDLREYLDEKFDNKADLVMLTEARRTIMKLEDRVSSLERWRAYIAGVAATALLLAGVVAERLFN